MTTILSNPRDFAKIASSLRGHLVVGCDSLKVVTLVRIQAPQFWTATDIGIPRDRTTPSGGVYLGSSPSPVEIRTAGVISAGASEACDWTRRDEIYAKHFESPAFVEKAKGVQARQSS